jgi:HlyD family secretion protein
MRAVWMERIAAIVAAVVLIAGLVWFALPRSIQVDLATATKGAMEVTVDDDAKTHVRHIYTVSAPIAGIVLRISHPYGETGISRHVGDRVTAGETVVAIMQPATPGFVDIRSRGELEATVAAADAAIKQEEAEIRRAQAALDLSRAELQRAEALARTQTLSVQALDKARYEAATNEAALASARAQLDMRQRNRESLAARLIDPASAALPLNPACCLQIRAPVSGRIIRIVQESEAVVQAGAPLVEIGDPLDLEIVADLLSSDAVQIKVGALVRIDGWGGPSLKGRVTRIDPAGFVEVSALGIEEQRVHTTIDMVDPPETWSRLGHDYRVVVHITVWAGEDVLTVPVGALFRRGDDWAVFAVKDGRARATSVKIGHRNNQTAGNAGGQRGGCPGRDPPQRSRKRRRRRRGTRDTLTGAIPPPSRRESLLR